MSVNNRHHAVNVRKVAGGFPRGYDPVDLAFLMPHLEDAADVVLAILALDEILRGPLSDH